jgi:hypothetical protein
MHGKVRFRVQRYHERSTGLKKSYFDLTDQFREGYLSLRLKEFVTYYAGRISYEEVEHLLMRTTGAKLLSDQKIQQLVVQKAAALSRMQQARLTRLKTRPMPAVCRAVDLYAAEAREVVLMEDGIQVKQQKAERERRQGAAGWQPPGEAPPLSEQKPRKKRVTTDVAMLEKRDGSYEHLCGGIDEHGREALYDVAEAVRGAVVEHYGNNEGTPLAVVAITDGAQNIRSHLERVFGGPIPVILDWYHLCKRLRELISMIARCKTERERHLERLFGHLWRGQTEQALAYLRSSTEVTARHPEKLAALITYLEKHQHEIVDYERRQQAGKTIGSGRMEKGVDQVIGHRQKKKGMCWSEKGSKALGILRVVELNGQWEEVWSGGAAA